MRRQPEPIGQRDAGNVTQPHPRSKLVLRKRILAFFLIALCALMSTTYVYHRSAYLGSSGDWHWVLGWRSVHWRLACLRRRAGPQKRAVRFTGVTCHFWRYQVITHGPNDECYRDLSPTMAALSYCPQYIHYVALSSRPKEKSMRFVIALLTLVFTARSTPPVSKSQSQAASPGQGLASEEPKPSTDSPMEFLIRSAATDFHAHRPPIIERFRDVRFGYVMTPAGAKQYQLCGEFLPQQREGKAKWTPFATIKTSGFEQYLGVQAASWCQRSRFVQDRDGDLSSTLQNRLDSMR